MSTGRNLAGRPRRAPLLLFVYIVLLFHISGYVGNEMATATLSVSMAIVEEGRLTIGSYTAGARELSWHEGRFYSGMPPGQSFIATPLYFVLRPAIAAGARLITPHLQHLDAAAEYGLDHEFAVRRLLLLIAFTVLLSAPCAAAACVMVVDIAEALGQRVGPLGALLLPLGTIWWTYGTEYGPRIMGGFLLLLPIWWMFVRRDRASERQKSAMAVAMGAGLVLAPLIRYELVLPAVAIGVCLIFQLDRRRIVGLALAAAVMAGVGIAYHAHCYGGPFNTPYSRKLWPPAAMTPKQRREAADRPRVEYENEEWIVWNQEGLISVTPPVVIRGLWAHPEALLRFSPFLVLVPVGAALLLWSPRTRGPGLLLVALSVISIVILLLLPHPGFRGAIGPRYVLWALPILVLLALPAWTRLPAAGRALLFAASFVPSCFAAMLTSHAQSAWSLRQLSEFGLTNYTLSRAQQAGLLITPTISTTIVLLFWVVVALVFLRPGSRWYMYGTPEPDADMNTASADIENAEASR